MHCIYVTDIVTKRSLHTLSRWSAYVVVQFNPWFKVSFLLFLGMVMYDNEFETQEKKIETKDKIEPQNMHASSGCLHGVKNREITIKCCPISDRGCFHETDLTSVWEVLTIQLFNLTGTILVCCGYMWRFDDLLIHQYFKICCWYYAALLHLLVYI